MRVHEITERLALNVDVFQALTAGVTPSRARWKPAPDAWSILEVVCHLVDEEVEDFRVRLDMTLHHPDEPWVAIDPGGWVIERRYRDEELERSVGRFVTERETSVGWLRRLEAVDWDRSHDHPRLGRMRAGDLLTSWLAHDWIHIRQLTRIHRAMLERELSGYTPDYAGSW